MSYEILYARAFIKIRRGIIPMILSGSNNCTTFEWRGNRQYEVRERHWWALMSHHIEANDLSEESYLAELESEKWLNEKNRDYEVFRTGGKWLTNGGMPGWFRSGCASACTIEEHLRFNPAHTFSAEIRVWPKERAWYTSHHQKHLCTTQQIEDWLDEGYALLEQYRKENPQSSVYMAFQFYPEKPIRKVGNAQGPVMVKQGRSYVYAYENGKALSFCDDHAKAVVFASREDAILQIGQAWFNRANLSFVKAVPQKEKTYILGTTGKHPVYRYIKRRSRNHLHFTQYKDYAKQFATQAEAVRYAKSVRERYSQAQIGGFVLFNTKDGSVLALTI